MKYVIIDTTRGKYWKYNNYGYTANILDARLFTKEDAEEKVNAPGVHDLIMRAVKQQFVATFGQGQENEGRYILINANCYKMALDYMEENYNGKYCNVYSKDDWDRWVEDANYLGIRVETILEIVTI